MCLLSLVIILIQPFIPLKIIIIIIIINNYLLHLYSAFLGTQST